MIVQEFRICSKPKLSPSTSNEETSLGKERMKASYSSAPKPQSCQEMGLITACLWDAHSPQDCACFTFAVTKNISVIKQKKNSMTGFHKNIFPF